MSIAEEGCMKPRVVIYTDKGGMGLSLAATTLVLAGVAVIGVVAWEGVKSFWRWARS